MPHAVRRAASEPAASGPGDPARLPPEPAHWGVWSAGPRLPLADTCAPCRPLRRLRLARGCCAVSRRRERVRGGESGLWAAASGVGDPCWDATGPDVPSSGEASSGRAANRYTPMDVSDSYLAFVVCGIPSVGVFTCGTDLTATLSALLPRKGRAAPVRRVPGAAGALWPVAAAAGLAGGAVRTLRTGRARGGARLHLVPLPLRQTTLLAVSHPTRPDPT